jgi:hypothetical protein
MSSSHSHAGERQSSVRKCRPGLLVRFMRQRSCGEAAAIDALSIGNHIIQRLRELPAMGLIPTIDERARSEPSNGCATAIRCTYKPLALWIARSREITDKTADGKHDLAASTAVATNKSSVKASVMRSSSRAGVRHGHVSRSAGARASGASNDDCGTGPRRLCGFCDRLGPRSRSPYDRRALYDLRQQGEQRRENRRWTAGKKSQSRKGIYPRPRDSRCIPPFGGAPLPERHDQDENARKRCGARRSLVQA